MTRHSRRVLPVLLVLVALWVPAWPAGAQEPHQLSIDQVIVSDDGASVIALISVLDAAGRPLPGLTGFETFIDGEQVELSSTESVVNTAAGIAVLLLIDVSGSMRGEPLEQARGAARSFVEGLLEEDVAAVATFASQAPAAVGYAADRGTLLSQIDRLQPERETGTALFDAVVSGLESAEHAPVTRRALVLLTDGRQSGAAGKQTRDDALRAAGEGGVPIFAIGLGEEADTAFLEELALGAGGAFYRAPAPADVPAIFDAIGAKLRGQYALMLPLERTTSGKRELIVTIDVAGVPLDARTIFEAPTIGAPAVGESEEGGSSAVVWLGLLALAAAAVVAAGALALSRRQGRPSAVATRLAREAKLTVRKAGGPVTGVERPGRLTVVAGPNEGVSVQLAAAPVDIGSGPGCALRLDAVDSLVAGIHVRVWLQSDRLMVHHVGRGKETRVGGKVVDWATLEAEDTLQIGPHVIMFSWQDASGEGPGG